jgi:hypothetical protein
MLLGIPVKPKSLVISQRSDYLQAIAQSARRKCGGADMTAIPIIDPLVPEGLKNRPKAYP